MEENDLVEEYIKEAKLRVQRRAYPKALEILQRAKMLPDVNKEQIEKIEKLIKKIEYIIYKQSMNHEELREAIDRGIEIAKIEETMEMPTATIQVEIEIAKVEGRIPPDQYEREPKDQIVEEIKQCIRIGDFEVAYRIVREAEKQEITSAGRKELEKLYGQIYQEQIRNEGR